MKPFSEMPLLTVSREAMKGEFEIAFPRAEFPQGTDAALDALDEVERIEQKLSVFRFDSKIQYVNLTAHESPVPLDDELFNLLALCQKFSAATEGAVDLTCSALWKLWGFSRREARLPSKDEIETAKQSVGYRHIELDSENRTIRLTKPGVELNLGCVGKGFALDVAAEKLLQKGVDRFLFHGGLSSVLAKGDGWQIGIKHPFRPATRLFELELADRALSTSGSQFQFFRHKGRRYSHIIDPRTGWSVEGVLAVTVTAQTATIAELLSTALFVLGVEKAKTLAADEKFCQQFGTFSAVFLLPTKRPNDFTVERI